MNILNDIWLAISTPNQTLIQIILIIGMFIEPTIILSLFTALLNQKATFKQSLLYVLINSIIGIITLFFIPSPFNIFINYIVPLLTGFLLFKNIFLKLSISIVLSLVTFNLIGIFILNPFLTIFHIDTYALTYVPLYRILYLLLIYLVAIILLLVIKLLKLNFKILDDIDKKNKMIILSNLFFGILAITLQSIILFYYVDILPIIITILSFISLLAYFAISFFSLRSLLKLILAKRKLESAESYNSSLQILHDSVRGFKHDFDNTITTIGGYIITNDIEGLKKYYSQLQEDCQKVNTLYLLNPSVVNNDGIYNLITKKYHEADSKNIKVNLTFLLDLNTLKMPIYEFARILGILLDNAIEASSESEDKTINLTFRNDFKSSRQLIIIENTFTDNNLDTEKIYEKGTSSKENHTGLGLWTVRKIIKKHNNINLFTSIKNNLFSQQLEIYY